MVLLRARVRRRDLLHRHHEIARSAAVDAQSRSGLKIYARSTSGEVSLRRTTPRPVVSESPRVTSEEDVPSEEARVEVGLRTARSKGPREDFRGRLAASDCPVTCVNHQTVVPLEADVSVV